MEENKMVKSKKMSKTGIAVIVLALLLVLSMVMGLTGAWFTDKADGEAQTVHFGSILVGLSGDSFTTTRAIVNSDSETTLVMPGDKVHYAATVTNSGENDLYYLIQVVFVDSVNPTGGFGVDGYYTDGSSKDANGTSQVVTAAKLIPHGNTGNTDSVDLVIDVPTSTGNSYQHATLQATLTVYTIQAANIASAEAAYSELTSLVSASFPADYVAPAVQP
jgi:uncharacterized repeat protein (TIGR01451 family)